jgi:signal transduction histidine kinase
MRKELDILIIEDVPRDAEAIEAELRQEAVAFRARRLETREQFIEALENAPPDIVLSDFTLPEFNALEALRVLQEIRPDIPFILVTGMRSEEVAVECIKEGADDYILKWSLKRLPTAIRSALRQRAIEREKAAAEAKLRELPRLILQAQESERRRVARELHDSVNQLLSSVKFRIQSLEARLPQEDKGPLHEDAGRTRTLLEKAIGEVRRISRNLRPSELDDLGLVPALRSLCAEFGERTGLTVDLQAPESLKKLPGEVELCAYRIVQEAMNNISKHAEAHQVMVELGAQNGHLHLCVRDDGRGFDATAVAARGPKDAGMGLLDIAERARLVGGVAAISSAPGTGTEVAVELPLRRSRPPVRRTRKKRGRLPA